MNRLKTTLTVALLLPLLLLSACKRRPIEDNEMRSDVALIHVRIDWSNSGIDIASPNEMERVSRVSIRFFPQDGSPVFDRYLAGNVTDGWIRVPVGKYSVVVFNESVDEPTYWEGAIYFTDVESYADFAAHAVPYDPAKQAADFPYYTPPPGANVIIGHAPAKLVPKLASWSLDEFEVTGNMALASQAQLSTFSLSAEEREMLKALAQIKMRCLTRKVNVSAWVKNLVSIQTNYAALSGFTHTVYMASGEATQSPSVHLFKLNGREYADQFDGTTSCSFLSFGRVPQAEAYRFTADVVYVTGELYAPDPPLKPEISFDVTPQVQSSTDPNINIYVNYAVEYVQGGIAVDDWGVDEVRPIK